MSSADRPAFRRQFRGQALAGTMIGPLLFSFPGRAQEDLGQDSVPPLPGPSDTVLPRSGIDPTISDLRDQLLRADGESPPSPASSGPNLSIAGQLDVSEEYTTSVGALVPGTGNRGSDFITRVQPGIDVVDTTQRLQVRLDYRPIGEIYAENSNFSQFEQQFDGSLTATVLPGWLYLDVRGSVSQQAVYGGLGPAGTVSLSPDNRQTASSFAISPYLNRALGSDGTVQIGASYTYSATDSPVGHGEPAVILGQFGTYGSAYLATKRVFASYTTGENLGRLRNKVGTDDSFYDGAGALAGARRLLFTDDVSYALNRFVTLLGEAGYEDLDYPRSDFAYTGPIGSAGVTLTPSRGSSLTVEYRYVDGFGSAYVQGSVQATPRIRVFGGYSSGISTFQQDLQNTLLDSASDVTGAAATGLQGAPLLQDSNAFGANQNLNKTHRLDATATYLGNNDTVTVSVNYQTTDPIGRQVGAFAPISTSGVFADVTAVHELTPSWSLTGFFQYGSNRTGLVRGVGNDDAGQTISISIGLNKTFTDTLTGYVRVGGTYVVGGSAFAAAGYQGLDGSNTTFIVGAVKRF